MSKSHIFKNKDDRLKQKQKTSRPKTQLKMKKLTVKDLQSKKNVILQPKQQQMLKGGEFPVVIENIDGY